MKSNNNKRKSFRDKVIAVGYYIVEFNCDMIFFDIFDIYTNE